MLVKIFSGAVNGIEATTITLEVNILNGAKFIIVGFPDNAVKESQQRIDSALREIGSRIPGNPETIWTPRGEFSSPLSGVPTPPITLLFLSD